MRHDERKEIHVYYLYKFGWKREKDGLYNNNIYIFIFLTKQFTKPSYFSYFFHFLSKTKYILNSGVKMKIKSCFYCHSVTVFLIRRAL